MSIPVRISRRPWLLGVLLVALAIAAGPGFVRRVAIGSQMDIYDSDARIASYADSFSLGEGSGGLPGAVNYKRLIGAVSVARITVKSHKDMRVWADLWAFENASKLVLADLRTGSVHVLCEAAELGNDHDYDSFDDTVSLAPGDYAIKVVGKDSRLQLSLMWSIDGEHDTGWRSSLGSDVLVERYS